MMYLPGKSTAGPRGPQDRETCEHARGDRGSLVERQRDERIRQDGAQHGTPAEVCARGNPDLLHPRERMTLANKDVELSNLHPVPTAIRPTRTTGSPPRSTTVSDSLFGYDRSNTT